MRGFAALLARELRRRLPLHLISLALGVGPVVAPWLAGGATAERAAEIRGSVAAVIALLWCFAIALLEGFTFLAGELRERRLSFDFRLPVSSAAIWASRLLAAIASIVAAAGMVLAGAALAGADLTWAFRALLEGPTQLAGIELESPAGATALVLLSVLLSLDLVGLAIASRKAWIGLDFTAVVTFKSVALLSIAPIWRATAEATSARAIVGATGAAVIALLFASWRQVAAGRTEPDRAHRAFSLTFAPLALLLLAPLSLWSHWFRFPPLDDLVPSRPYAVPLSENLGWLNGMARHRGEVAYQFLADWSTGRAARLGLQHQDLRGAQAKISLDGSTIAWTEIDRIGVRRWRSTLLVVDASGPWSGSRVSDVSWDGIPTAWALSPDGSRVASVWTNADSMGRIGLRVEELDSGRIVDRISLGSCFNQGPLQFLTERQLVYGCGTSWDSGERPPARILRIDLETREVATTGVASRAARPVDLAFARAEDRWFEPPSESTHGSGETIGWIHLAGRAAIPIAPPETTAKISGVDSARFLSGGRLAVSWRAETEGAIAFYGRGGNLESTLSLRADEVDLLSEAPGSVLILALRFGGSRIPTPALLRVPLDGGAPVEVARGLFPNWPDSAATPATLFYRASGEALRLDLSTGRLLPLFAAF